MSTVYMQLQNTYSGLELEGLSVIPFEVRPFYSDTTDDITYSPSDSAVIINVPGVYYIDWELYAQEMSYPSTLLMVEDGDMPKAVTADTSIKSNQVTGSAAVKIVNPGARISLYSKKTVRLATTPAPVNFIIHSLDMNENIVAPEPVCGGSIINFQSGVLDCPICNPFSWPILLNVLQISWLTGQCDKLKEMNTIPKLETLLSLPEGALADPAIQPLLQPALKTISDNLQLIPAPIAELTQVLTNTGLFSTDVYLNHADIQVVPAIFGADIPILSLSGGPLTPQIIAQDGFITSFAAEYDCVVACDISLGNTIPGIIAALNQILGDITGAIGVLIGALASVGSILSGNGTPLLSDWADILNGLIFRNLMDASKYSNNHVHAILWKRSDEDGNFKEWQKVSDLDLGPVPWAELAPLDSFVSAIGDIVTAGADLLSMILTLFTHRGAPNDSPTITPFRAALDKEIHHPISAGDYLIVQFTLDGGDDITLLAGVIATNLMASVGIDCE